MTSTTTAQQTNSNANNILKEVIPTKSPSDPRDYKIITLSNDLECILVSDPDAEKYVQSISFLHQPQSNLNPTQRSMCNVCTSRSFC